ncbi:MAG: response regulator [Chloroflexota bacterium]|nr:response regulator [Chloroflexota bacterium]
MSNKVMIVDDDPSILLAAKTVLELADFDVITADGGKSCLQELASGFRGVILMDVMMPKMDGWATIREIVANGYFEGNLISMLTAKDVPDLDMEGLAEYVLNYTRKPFKPQELISLVREYTSYLE